MKRRAFFPLLAGAALSGVASGKGRWFRSPWLDSQDFLCSRQSSDGAWRSPVYGAFKDGHGLTPLVLLALVGSRRTEVRAACARAVAWVQREMAEGVRVFPVHHASWLLQVAQEESRMEGLVPGLRRQLSRLQMGSALGWGPEDDCFGGWSYASRAVPKKEGLELASMQQPNLSATILALFGLGSGRSRTVREAGTFVRSCQNFSASGGRFDDGGFFQMPHDPTRNKAGVAGEDRLGRRRFRSYASATADGLRGLLLTGVDPAGERVQAAARWLEEHGVDDVADLRFYASYARTSAFRLLEDREGSVRKWRGDIAELEQFRRADGSYCNPAGEMRENDPLVATSLALIAGRMQGVV
jgi:hypothetical protein